MLTNSGWGIVNITIAQQGNNVVVSGSGTLNVADLMPVNIFSVRAGIGFPVTTVITPDNSGHAQTDGFTGAIDGPSSIGTGLAWTNISPDSVSPTNDVFGITLNLILAPNPVILTPEGTASTGFATVSGTMTYLGATIDSLQLTPGVYTWTWGSGENADSLTLTIVPEPATWPLLLGIGVACLLVVRRRRQL